MDGSAKLSMKKIVVAIIGGTVVLIGLAMTVLPGPAIVVIPAGIAILATEFVWARRWLNKGKRTAGRWKKARAAGLSRWAAFKQCLSRRPKTRRENSNCPADTPANPR